MSGNFSDEELCLCVCVCGYFPPVPVLPDVSHRATLMQLFGSDGGAHVKNAHVYLCTPTPTNICANETRGAVAPHVHAVPLSLRRKQSQQNTGGKNKEYRRKWRAEEWILLIAIVIPHP